MRWANTMKAIRRSTAREWRRCPNPARSDVIKPRPHLHGDHAAHLSFPKTVWAKLFEQGRVVHHPVFPERVGPAARRIEDDADVRDVIEFMRLNYDRFTECDERR